MFEVVSFSLDGLVKFLQNTATFYGFVGVIWAGLFILTGRVAAVKAKARREKDETDAQTALDYKRKEAELYEERRDKAKDGVVAELERRTRTLSAIGKELRRLLKDSMTYSDRRDKWVSILEAIVGKHEPDALLKRPEYTDHPTADDVASIYAEHGTEDGMP